MIIMSAVWLHFAVAALWMPALIFNTLPAYFNHKLASILFDLKKTKIYIVMYII